MSGRSDANSFPARSKLDGRAFFRYALGVGLLLRLVILWRTSTLGTGIIDEQQYGQIASTLLTGGGFGWGPGDLTSIRPPLYPAFLASVWALFGPHNLQAVRALQIGLAFATTALVYQLAFLTNDRTTARFAAGVFWLYPSLVFFNFLMLTETLFTFLLVAFVLLAVLLVRRPQALTALGCGLALGLAALTRSVLWPVPIVLCPLLALMIRAPISRRLALAGLALLGYAVVVAPWAVRNTRLQEVVTIVDTMGGLNLRMGNYEYTPDDRMWDAVALAGDKNWVYGFTTEPGQKATEGRKDKWAQRKAIEYMTANPGTTFRRSLIKFGDFWGLEREFIAGVQTGLFAPPTWFAIAAALLMVLSYALVVVVGAAGMWLTPPRDWPTHLLLLFPVALFVAAHSIIFGHSRYHLPLIPIFAIYAAHLVVHAPAARPAPKSVWIGAGLSAAVLAAIWVRQVVVVDLERIKALFHHVA